MNTTFRKIANFLFLVLFTTQLLAQQGIVRGTVIDDASGETLIGVAVALVNSSTGTATDFDGAFELSLDPGIYDIQVSYISYQPLTITDIEVKAGEVNLLSNIRLMTEAEQLEEVVITAAVVRTSEAALMTIKRKSSNLVDGISSAKFKKIGDSNAAGAVKRVTGVSVEGGKYVYVRGLGDRYSKTMLNSVDIPGLDPDKNSLQIDIFPTNLLNNMVVYKSSLAELPSDFTGGLVNIETKDFPEEKIFDISIGMGYNPSMHFKDNYLDYQGSGTDWLGFDNGTRALPLYANQQDIPSPITNFSEEVTGDFISSFNPTLAAQEKLSLPDFSFGMSYGNQKTLKNDNTLGYIFSGTYKSSRAFYEDLAFGEYQLQVDNSANDLLYSTTINGRSGEENVLLGGLAGIAYKSQKAKHRLTVIHLQNGNSKAAKFNIDNNSDAIGQSGYTATSDNLEYSQRRITNVLLNGEYKLNGGDWKIDWRLSPTLSSLTDPDVRKTAYSEFGEGNIKFIAGAGGNPSRIWRYLDEVNVVGKVDITRKFDLFDRDAKLKFGVSHLYKERDYNILGYNMQFFGEQPEWTGDADEVLTPENIYPAGTIYYNSLNNTPNPNEYNSHANNTGVYVSTEVNPTETLKATIGLRGERFEQRHTGRDSESANSNGEFGNALDNAVVLSAVDLFPSLNVIQSIKDNQNLRFSYAKTIARPSFKELSFAQILDPITDRIFNGGLFVYNDWDGNLTETRIQNLDLRWEYFMDRGQLFSASVFYKNFDSPIELVRNTVAVTSSDFQPRNVGRGQSYGAEFELRKHFGFISENLSQLSFNTNVTVVQSAVKMSSTEYNSRVSNKREGQEISDTRSMAGQAPYIINAGISYNASDKPLDFGLYYNVKGRTLTVVGGGVFTDVYTNTFHSLNFSMNHAFGEDEKLKASVNVNNILGSKQVAVFDAYNAADQVFSSLSPGTSIGLSLSYSIF